MPVKRSGTSVASMHKAVRHTSTLAGVNTIAIHSDRTFPRHTHDEFGFGLMQSGGHKTWSGRGLVEASAGDIITVNPGELHDGVARAGEPRTWRMFFLSPKAVANLVDQAVDQCEFRKPVLRAAEISALVRPAVDAAMQDHADASELEQLLALALGRLIDPRDIQCPHTEAPPPLRRVMERIHAEWPETLVLDDLAETAGLSRYQTLRAFSREFGLTPHAYLVQYRLNRARELILGGDGLAEAAVASGFTDQSHMTRAFTRQFGITPGRYLKTRDAR